MKNQDWSNRKTEVFNQNDKIVRTLPLGGKITKIDVHLYGNVVVSGGTANGTARYTELLAMLLKRIRVRTAKAAGSRYPDGIIRDYSPRTLLRRAQMYRGKYIADMLATAVSGAAATYAIDYVFPIYFSQPDLGRSIECALNVDKDAVQNVQVEVDTGSRDTAFSGSDRAWDTSNLKLDFVDQRENIAGDTYVLVEEDHELLIDGASTRKEDKLMPQDGSLLDVLVMAQTGSEGAGSATLASTIFNGVRIAGGNIDLDLKARDIQFSMYDPLVGSQDAGQAITGLYHVNFVTSKRLSKIVPAAGLDIKYDVSNPSGAGLDSLLVTARRLFQPSGYTPIAFGQKAKNAA
jgi:hypothetical protein